MGIEIERIKDLKIWKIKLLQLINQLVVSKVI